MVLLTETGLRVAREGLSLKWIDVDLIDGVLFVRDTKTPAGIRAMPLSNFCTAALADGEV